MSEKSKTDIDGLIGDPLVATTDLDEIEDFLSEGVGGEEGDSVVGEDGTVTTAFAVDGVPDDADSTGDASADTDIGGYGTTDEPSEPAESSSLDDKFDADGDSSRDIGDDRDFGRYGSFGGDDGLDSEPDHGPRPEARGPGHAESDVFTAKARPSDYTTDAHDMFIGGKKGDDFAGGGGTDIIKSKSGDDTINGSAGDDWIRAGHGDDEATGGSGDDVVDGGKGDDRLVYTFADNVGSTDYYDGGKGSDTLVLRMTAAEAAEHETEIADLKAWISDNANVKNSGSHGFNDAASSSAKHPVFETSFGLTVRNFETLEVQVIGSGPAPAPEPAPALAPEAAPEAAAEEIKVNISELPPGEAIPVSVTLKPGSSVTVSVDVEVTELPPKFDVFMVQDLSGSFYNDLPNVKALFPSLVESLSVTSDVAFGIGSFVDKTVAPFGSAAYGDYVYKTDKAIDTDTAAVQEALDGLRTYWGWDWPESQLEALVQVALRGEEIGFRDGAQKFVVLSTDAPPHVAGDYATASDGANNYDTVIDDEDYPDPAIVGDLLIAAGITPIFAVTAPYISVYQELVDSWGVGNVVELAYDSANIVDAITTGLKEATIDLTVDISSDDYGYVAGMTPEVYADAGPGIYTFDITLKIPSDAESYGSDALTLTIPGYGEIALDIDIVGVDVTGDSAADTLVGDAGPNAIYGLAGDDKLDGGGGDDVIDGGTGDDVLTGGAGSDIFVFATGDGKDVITDFGAGDVLDLRRMTSVASETEVLAVATYVGTDTVIDFGAGDSVTLMGVAVEDLDGHVII